MLDGVCFEAAPGTVLGLLDPNGAGKTTALRVLATLLAPDSGTARVAGLDVVADARRLRHRIGLAGQYAAIDENLTGLENLVMVGLDEADRLADRIAAGVGHDGHHRAQPRPAHPRTRPRGGVHGPARHVPAAARLRLRRRDPHARL